MIRDALRRYGHENLGLFWVVGEPMLLTCGIMLVWTVMGVSHGGEVAVIPFALTGYTYITLWRHVVNRASNIMQGNMSLSYHRCVKPLDSMIAMTLVELLGVITVFLTCFLPLWCLEFSPGIQDPFALFGGYVLLVWFSFGLGLILAGLSEMSDLVHHLIPPLLYLTLPITGTFFMVDWLPDRLQKIMVWSPLVNGIEMVRAGIFPAEVPTHWSVSYLVACSLSLSAIGLVIFKYAENHMEV